MINLNQFLSSLDKLKILELYLINMVNVKDMDIYNMVMK